MLEAREKLSYAKVLHDINDDSWKIRNPGRGTIYPEWKEHLIKMRFQDEDGDYYETTQSIVCYNSEPGSRDSTTCTHENGCFFCIGGSFDRPVQELYDIERIWQFLEYEEDYKRQMKDRVFHNWENGYDSWGEPIFNNIKGSEE